MRRKKRAEAGLGATADRTAKACPGAAADRAAGAGAAAQSQWGRTTLIEWENDEEHGML